MRSLQFSQRRKALEMGLLIGFLAAVVFTLAGEHYQAVCRQVCGDTLRLHILANSDTQEDQALKLKVRDALLTQVTALVDGAAKKQEACARLSAALPELKSTAQRTLRENGSSQTVSVRLENFEFPSKDYGDFSLPAGNYTALRVELGSAKGHNWFCVLYPELCVGSTRARYTGAEENAVVFGKYEVRLALLDGLHTLAEHTAAKQTPETARKK
jgi:stage II sporulation protein R